MEIGVITNPNSRKNKNRPDRAQRLRSIVGSLGEVHETPSVDSIKPILRDFLRRRARYWVADGGDGALHWMLKLGIEVLEEPEFAGGDYTLPMTLPTRGGTIDFIAGNVGIVGRAEEILAGLRSCIETGQTVEEVVVDSMHIRGVEVIDGRDETFNTYGFACAAGGVGQRFFDKYYEDSDPNPRTIVKVVAKSLASMPVSMTPLKYLPGLSSELRSYASEVFEQTRASVSIDGDVLPDDAFSGIHIASMSINLGNVFRLFNRADTPGKMHAIVGAPSPLEIVRNLPRMTTGRELVGESLTDRPCETLEVRATGDELLSPIIDGESYSNIRSMKFDIGPRVRIAKVV